MPWPIPQPGDIASRAASVFESEMARVYLLKNPGASPLDVTVDARSPYSQMAVYGRVLDMATQDQWFFQARTVQELMPDTAIDWLPRHAAIWNVPRTQATPAIGSAVFSSVAGVAVPAGLALSVAGGLTYTTTVATTIAPNSTADIPIACATPGSAGNLPAGTVLQVVNVFAGLTTQTATVDANGLMGADAETTASWQSRILAAIRNRGSGGNGADFQAWASAALPGAYSRAMSPGAGLITVAFAMPATIAVAAPDGSGTLSLQTWQAPSPAQIAVVSAYLNDSQNRKPLGAPLVNVVAATLQPVNFTLALNPSNVVTQTAAINALALQVLADATIGGTLYLSRIQAALENATGEFSDELTVPAADVAAAATTLSIFGAVTFQ